MATLKDMVDEVHSNLTGYTLRQDRVTYVADAAGITTTDTTITVPNENNLANGIIEIDEELIWVESFDNISKKLNIAPGFGRGYRNTNPAPHSQYAQITLSPTFPKSVIKKAINDTIKSVYPKIWGVSSTTFTYKPAQVAYALPDDVQEILAVSWQTVGPSKEWLPVVRWRQDRMANATAFNTNKTISLYDRITAGRTVQVWYAMQPNTLDSNTDEFADVSGLPESAEDVVVLGAAYRLLSFIDAGRLNLTSAESDSANTKIPSSASVSTSKYIYALYQQRLNEEAGKLQSQYPTKVHYTR
jgi:hypothetical protein